MQSTHHHEHIVVYSRYAWLDAVLSRRYIFLGTFCAVFAVTYSVLYAFDLYPVLTQSSLNASSGEKAVSTVVAAKTPTMSKRVVPVSAMPEKLLIPKLNREVEILNPKDDAVATLDAALLHGVARHPDSADFRKTGTMFIVGHSSYLPNVKNKAFQALNGIQKLEWGDKIHILSADTEYIYRVQSVYEAKASLASADIVWGTSRIILVTCNSFGTKDDRYVVEGYLIESNPIAQGSAQNEF
jgi:LPXTG-site transpeptidase (sortase) family protein